MKKVKIASILLSFVFLCNSCEFLNQLTCNHQYKVISEESATCSSYGKITKECELCQKVVTEKTDKLPHNYKSEVVKPDCVNQGYTNNVCLDCGHNEKNNYVDALGHDFSDWVIVQQPNDVTDGIKERVCKTCEFVEKEYVMSKNYADLSVIKEEFDPNNRYDCNSYEEILAKFNAAVLYMSNKLSVLIKYDEKDLKGLLNRLVNDCSVNFSLAVDATMTGSLITFNFKYDDFASRTTSQAKYVQYDSFNVTTYDKKREDNFDDFKINNSSLTYEVFSSEQLHYVLEKGVRPVCKKGSQAEKVYNEAKKVLRNIINDDMSDAQKVKAINDYLVMNVVYDGLLLDMAYQNYSKLVEYNGFYLEGVFFDKKAVCEGISKAFTVLCNIEGIPCVSVVGYDKSNPKGVGHAWNKVYVNGGWYIADATSNGVIANEQFEIMTYSYLLTSEEYFSEKYIGTNYTDLSCNEIYNVYALSTYTHDNVVYDLSIDSIDELKFMLEEFYKVNSSPITVEFYATFDFGTSLTDEINDALSRIGISANYSYIDNKEYFVLIR